MSVIESNLLETVFAGIAVAVAFPIGALIAVLVPYKAANRALFAAFGAGIFLAATMLITQQALALGNVFDLLLGFSLGVVAFGIAAHQIRHGKDKNGQPKQRSEGKLSIIGTVLDSVPESLFIGIIAALRQPGLSAAVLVLFIGNLSITLEGAKIMHHQGLGKREILQDWLADFFIVAVAAPIGYLMAESVSTDVIAMVLSFAAGALIVFIAGELISRAYRESAGHNADISISIGFLTGIILLFVI